MEGPLGARDGVGAGRGRGLAGAREAQAADELLEARLVAQGGEVRVLQEVVDIVVAEADGVLEDLEGLEGALGQSEGAAEVVLDRRVFGEQAREASVELEACLPLTEAGVGLGQFREGFDILRLPLGDDPVEVD